MTTTMYLPPVNCAVWDVKYNFSICTSLGITDYVTMFLPQNFLEAPDTALRTITIPSMIATSYPETTSRSSTTNPAIIWIQESGFYWSPVASLTPLPLDVSSYLILFLIDCPPNKNFLPPHSKVNYCGLHGLVAVVHYVLITLILPARNAQLELRWTTGWVVPTLPARPLKVSP